MKSYVAKLKVYVEQDQFAWKERKAEGILDYLEQCYLEENPVESEETKAIEKEMGPIYEALPLEMSDKLFRLVYDLCGKYEKAAFREGRRVGLHVREELGRL